MPQFKPEANAPENPDALAHALARQRSRRRRWLLVKLLVFLILLLGGAVFYLQSTHALQHIYLPMLSRRLGAQVTVTDGSIGLSGAAELVGLDVTAPDKSRIFHADLLTARAAPWSLLGSRPHLRDVALEAPQARVYVAKDGTTNWDFLFPPKKRPAAAQAAPSPRPAAPKEKTSVIIDRLKISKAQVQLENAEQLDLTLTRLDLSLDQFGRGRTGAFGLDAEGYLDRPGIRQTFGAAGRGSLTQDAAGRELGWNSTLDARLSPEARPGATTQTVTLQASLAGKSTLAGRLDQDFTLNAATPAGPAGQFKGTIRWDPAAKEHHALIDAVAVSRELLNPILAAIGPVQLERSRLDGTCRIDGRGDAIVIETRVTGADLAFRVGESQSLTPPASLVLVQRGAYDLSKKILKLENAELTLQEKGKPVLETKLDRPVELQVGTGGADAANISARFNTTLTNLAVATLQPWLILAGVKQAEELRAGTLNGQILSVVENAGATIVLDGQVRGVGLRVPSWKDLPLDVTQSLKGRIEKLETIVIESAQTALSGGGRKLAEIDARGRFSTSGTGEATVRLVCAQTAATARTLGWLEERTITIEQDGRLEAAQTITLPGAGRPAAIKGAATLAGIVLAGPAATLPLAGKADYDVTVDANALVIQTLKAAWTAAAAAAPATLEVKGNWPLAAGRRGEVKLTARAIDLVPYLRLTAQPGALTLASLPLEADETLTALEDGTNKLAGELRLGPIPSAGIPDEVDAPVSVSIKTTLDRLGDRVQRLVLELASKTRKGAADKAALTGDGTWNGKQIALHLGGRIDQLHADGYLALASLLRGGSGAPPSSEVPPSGGVRSRVPPSGGISNLKSQISNSQTSRTSSRVPPSGGAPARALLIDISPFEIGKLTYQRGELADAKGSFRYENGVGDLKLETGKLCGGGIAGTGQFDASRAEPRYAWEVALKQVDSQALSAMVRPDVAAHLTGKGDIASRGSGQGLGAGAGRLLQSESGFLLTSGEIRNFFLLDALAKQTQVAEFKNLQFFEFSGRVNTAGGVATLKNWIETGKDQRVGLEGTMSLDGKYDLAFSPAIHQDLAGRLGQGGGVARQLLTDTKGYVTLPVQVAITGQGSKYQLGARMEIGKDSQAQLNDALRGTLKGVIGDRNQKQQGGQPDKKSKEGEGQAKAGEPATNAPPETTPQPGVTPAPAAPGLDNLLNQGLQMYQDREREKKEKEAEKKRKKEEKKKKDRAQKL